MSGAAQESFSGSGKKLVLRWPGACEVCASELSAGTQAWWFRATKSIRCVSCVVSLKHQESATRRQPATVTSIAGASAQREYEKRSARELAKKEKAVVEDEQWRQRAKQQRPVIGRLAAALTPKPVVTPESQSTRAWKVGAEGERVVGALLDGLATVRAFHDLRVPGSRANIDHIAVAESGVYVIDSKKYSGRIESRDVGTFWKADHRLYVAGRDRTKLVESMAWQVGVVRKVLGPAFDEVPVHGVLCFVDGQFGLLPNSFRIDDVDVVWPRELAKLLNRSGGVGAHQADAIANVLGGTLRAAA